MFFNLINASTIFQVYINYVMTELLDIICIVYLNDILIYFCDSKKHAKHVWMMLKHLRAFKLYVKLSKCWFNFTEIFFLNFHINIDNVSMKSNQIIIIMNWSTSEFFNEVQIFLKFANFYYWFIEDYLQVICYLTDLLKDFVKKWKIKFF